MVDFKTFFCERFQFSKRKLPYDIAWKKIGETQTNGLSWMTSFGYDLDTNSIVASSNTKENVDIYHINANYLKDPYSPDSNVVDITKKYPQLVKREPYWWVDFFSIHQGTETISKETETHRNARLIFKTVIDILANKIPKQSNICFTSDSSQASKISLYTTLANLLARQTNKKVDIKNFKGEVYFFIH